jgi:hypothetical protein
MNKNIDSCLLCCVEEKSNKIIDPEWLLKLFPSIKTYTKNLVDSKTDIPLYGVKCELKYDGEICFQNNEEHLQMKNFICKIKEKNNKYKLIFSTGLKGDFKFDRDYYIPGENENEEDIQEKINNVTKIKTSGIDSNDVKIQITEPDSDPNVKILKDNGDEDFYKYLSDPMNPNVSEGFLDSLKYAFNNIFKLNKDEVNSNVKFDEAENDNLNEEIKNEEDSNIEFSEVENDNLNEETENDILKNEIKNDIPNKEIENEIKNEETENDILKNEILKKNSAFEFSEIGDDCPDENEREIEDDYIEDEEEKITGYDDNITALIKINDEKN